MKDERFIIPFVIITALFIVVLVVMLVFLINNLMVVWGNSMRPTINSSNIVKCVPQNNYAFNDVVCYWSGWHKVCHRIVGRFNDSWILKGDNNAFVDKKILKDNEIICKVMMIKQ